MTNQHGDRIRDGGDGIRGTRCPECGLIDDCSCPYDPEGDADNFCQYILKQRPLCQLPLCCNPSTVVLDPHTPEMLAVCQTHADLYELPLDKTESTCQWYDEQDCPNCGRKLADCNGNCVFT